ncbi:MAG: hypothetical protein H7Z43_08120 [Clostridia bacterium]|nr:hypothetical protein [Deltaproteobacteria bacterium]
MVLIANAAATWLMVGVIWTIQLVHYPLFDRVASERFVAFHTTHSTRITWVVAPAMLTELVTSGVLAWHGKPVARVGFVCAALAWIFTGLLSVPAHNALARGFDAGAHARLVSTNWLRTAIWTLHGVLVVAMLTE